MTYGALDLPAPLWNLVDAAFDAARIPALIRIAVFGALAGWLGMLIYRRASPQQRLSAVRIDLAIAQRALAGYDGELSGLWPLLRRQLGLALTQMRLSASAALLAGLPFLLLMPWLSNRFDTVPPGAGTPTEVCVEPAEVMTELRWEPTSAPGASAGCRVVAWPSPDGKSVLYQGDAPLFTLPTVVPVRDRWHWYNVAIGNPSGYLPDDSNVARVRADVPSLELIRFGPRWIRGWEAIFLASAIATSLLLKWLWKLS
jgi:hypothetical protein